MAKLTENILKFLAAAGVKLTEKEQQTVSGLENDADVSAELQAVFDKATNDTTSEMTKLGARAANLDKFDEGLASWADVLGDDVKTIAGEKGLQKLDKIKAKISLKIEEAKKAAQAGDSADVAKLREQITALEANGQKLQAEMVEAVNKAKEESKAEVFNHKMLTKLSTRKDIIEHFRSEDAMTKLVLPSILEHVGNNGLKITDKLEVIKADTETPLLRNAVPVTVDDMIEEALTAKRYRQLSGEKPPKTQIEITESNGGEGTKVSRISALRPEARV